MTMGIFGQLLQVAARASSARALAAVLAAVAVPFCGASAQTRCEAPRELVRLGLPLVATQRAVARGSHVRIVALGSSSTQGTGASSAKTCYPARLEAELNGRFSKGAGTAVPFEVANLGVGGQLADNMLARIDTEVLPLRPHLVIWQTGVNDVIEGVPLESFRTTLVQGIDALQAAGIDVMLLDSQYYPRSAAVHGFRQYLAAMREIAHDRGVPIFSRYKVMRYLIDSAQFTPVQLLSPDQFHLNDLSYSCISSVMADAITDGIQSAGGIAHASLAPVLPGARAVNH